MNGLLLAPRLSARAVTLLAILAAATSVGCGSGDSTTPTQGGPCTPNDDGVVGAVELNSVAGASGEFSRAMSALVSTAPSGSSGQSVWDFTGPYPGEQLVTSTLEPMSGTWFASDFPDASYAWWIESLDLYAVYRVSAGSVSLLGYASKTNEATSTTLTHYDSPLLMFRAPLAVGDSWQSSGHLTGSTPLGPIDFDDAYSVSVDGRGTMLAPAGSFQIVRVNGLATRDDSGVKEAHRQQYYLAECRGIVGAVRSETVPGSTVPEDFTIADEIARLAK